MSKWFLKSHPQQVTLKTATVLVGRAPTKEKRIRAVFTLALSSGEVKGMPEWLADAATFVMQHPKQTVTEQLQVPGVNISFGDPNLFKKKTVEAPNSDIRKFEVYSVGKEDDPETELGFTIYTKFSTDLWRWVGQQAGTDFTATFDVIVKEVEAVNPTLELSGEAQADEDEEEEDDDEDEEDEEEDEQVGQQRRAQASQQRRNNTPRQPTPAQIAKAKANLKIH